MSRCDVGGYRKKRDELPHLRRVLHPHQHHRHNRHTIDTQKEMKSLFLIFFFIRMVELFCSPSCRLLNPSMHMWAPASMETNREVRQSLRVCTSTTSNQSSSLPKIRREQKKKQLRKKRASTPLAVHVPPFSILPSQFGVRSPTD